MSASNLDKFLKGARKLAGTIDASGITNPTVDNFGLSNGSGIPTTTGVEIIIERVDSNGAETPTKEETILGVVSGDRIISAVRGVEGTAQAHPAGSAWEMLLTADQWNRMIDGILLEHNQDGSHKNIVSGIARQAIINGNFIVNQRGYVSGAALSAGVYGHDRFKAGASGGDYSFTQLASSTQITIAAAKSLIQVIEDKNVVGGTYTLSWTGTAQARYAINSVTPAGSYASSPIVITGQSPGTVMSVEFNTGTLGQVQLNSGAVAFPFQAKSFEEELRMCQRYYQRFVSGGAYNPFAMGYATTTTTSTAAIFFKNRFRAVPTFSSAGSFTIAWNVGGYTVSNISAGMTLDFASIDTTHATGVTAGQGTTLQANNDATAYLAFNAEL